MDEAVKELGIDEGFVEDGAAVAAGREVFVVDLFATGPAERVELKLGVLVELGDTRVRSATCPCCHLGSGKRNFAGLESSQARNRLGYAHLDREFTCSSLWLRLTQDGGPPRPQPGPTTQAIRRSEAEAGGTLGVAPR